MPKSFVAHQFKTKTIEDTEIRVWQERDRLHVALHDKGSDKTLIEWRDDDAREAIEDGFLDIKEAVLGSLERFVKQGGALHQSAWDYWSSARRTA